MKRFLYCAYNAQAGVIKVGLSAYLAVRMRQLSTREQPLVLLAHKRGSISQERALHRRLRLHRADHWNSGSTREWYRTHPEVLAALSELLAVDVGAAIDREKERQGLATDRTPAAA